MHTPFNHLHSTCVQFQFSTCKSWFNVLQSFKIDLINKIWLIKGCKKVSLFMYTVLHIFPKMLFWARNQKPVWPILATQETLTDFHGDEEKKLKIKSKMANKKKTANSQYFFAKIGPCVSRINWCEGDWCSSTYMVIRMSDVSSKTG